MPTASAVDGATGRRSYVIKYVASRPVEINGRRLQLQVTMRSSAADRIGAAIRSGQFLGYGNWELWPKPENVRGRIELRLWVEEPWQVARWDTDDTRQTFPPLPPAARPVPKPAPRCRPRQS
ncbi:hypothetical protein ACIRL3_25580 [Streptomyces sp. NPDC102384]|uniref:hypothetical protein n=1 Tax=Streptomyces sp. NPDC102384 TaxID=3366166 RepID=UPI0038143E8D